MLDRALCAEPFMFAGNKTHKAAISAVFWESSPLKDAVGYCARGRVLANGDL